MAVSYAASLQVETSTSSITLVVYENQTSAAPPLAQGHAGPPGVAAVVSNAVGVPGEGERARAVVVRGRGAAAAGASERGAVELQGAAHAARLLLREVRHAGVRAVVHVVPDGVAAAAAGGVVRAVVLGGRLGVRVADPVARRVAVASPAAAVERVVQPEVVADLVHARPALVVGRDGSVPAHRRVQEDHAIARRADGAPAGLGQEGHVAEDAARAAGGAHRVDVHVHVRVPGDAVPVAAAVVVPGVVVVAVDARARLTVGVGCGQDEPDLGVGALGARGPREGQEVLVEDVHLAVDAAVGHVPRAVGLPDDVPDDRDLDDVEVRGRVRGRRVGRVRAAVARGERAGHGVVHGRREATDVAVGAGITPARLGTPGAGVPVWAAAGSARSAAAAADRVERAHMSGRGMRPRSGLDRREREKSESRGHPAAAMARGRAWTRACASAGDQLRGFDGDRSEEWVSLDRSRGWADGAPSIPGRTTLRRCSKCRRIGRDRHRDRVRWGPWHSIGDRPFAALAPSDRIPGPGEARRLVPGTEAGSVGHLQLRRRLPDVLQDAPLRRLEPVWHDADVAIPALEVSGRTDILELPMLGLVDGRASSMIRVRARIARRAVSDRHGSERRIHAHALLPAGTSRPLDDFDGLRGAVVAVDDVDEDGVPD